MAVDVEQRPAPDSPPDTEVIPRIFNLTVLGITADRIEVMARVAKGPFRRGFPDTCPLHKGSIDRQTGNGWLGDRVDFPRPTPEQEAAAGGVFVGAEDGRKFGGLIGLSWVFKRMTGGTVDYPVYPAVTDGNRAVMIRFAGKRPTGKETSPGPEGIETRWDGNKTVILATPVEEVFASGVSVFTAHPRHSRQIRFFEEGFKGGVKKEVVGTGFEDELLYQAGIKTFHWQSENGHLEYNVSLAERVEDRLYRIAPKSRINLVGFNRLLREQGFEPGVNGHGVYAATGTEVVYTNGGVTAPNLVGVQETVVLLSTDDSYSYILSDRTSEVVAGGRNQSEVPWKVTPIKWMN